MMKVNHVIVANFYVDNMSFNAIREIKTLAKISQFTVLKSGLKCAVSLSKNTRTHHNL